MPRPIQDCDRSEIDEFTRLQWHAPHVFIRGRLYYPRDAEGFVVRREDRIAGLITFEQQGDAMLLLTHNSTQPGAGIGTALLLRVIEEARARGVRRIWLTTTNDNLRALGFYQRMGFHLRAVYPGAVTEARRTIKPEVPETGLQGLPIRDEIELDLILDYS